MALAYEKLGRRIEDMNTELNYESEDVTDVTGVTDNETTKGPATTEMNPVTFSSESRFAQFLDHAIERGLELDDLKIRCTNVKLYKRIGADYESGKPLAYRQYAIVVPGTYAISNKALQSSCTLKWIGEKEFGTFDVDATGEKFTPETTPPTSAEIHYKDGKATRSDYYTLYEYDDAIVI